MTSNHCRHNNRPPESALLCTWHHSEIDANFLVPELYRYMLPPYERCESREVQQRLWDLDVNFQRFAAVGRRAFLLGDADDDATWNVAVELQLDQLPNGV
jgi:hypothetical protein